MIYTRHTLRGCVDWNQRCKYSVARIDRGHTLRGCVDWNTNREEEVSLDESHPAWVCGLKRRIYDGAKSYHRHTLRGCVDWNEQSQHYRHCEQSHTLRGCVDWNISQQQLQIWDVSHPAWVCGLKLKRLLVEILSDRSHPAWVCGLKLLSHGFYLSTICHTLRGCVDWNRINGASFLTSAMSHPAWVCGLKLYLCLPILIAFGSHTLRGCVDWNRYSFLCLRKTSVTPCVGVWIET